MSERSNSTGIGNSMCRLTFGLLLCMLFTAQGWVCASSTTISGLVLFNGEPINQAEVLIKKRLDNIPQNERFPIEIEIAGRGWTDASGRFSILPFKESPNYTVAALWGPLGNFRSFPEYRGSSVTIHMRPIIVLRGKITCPEKPELVGGAKIAFKGAAATSDIHLFEADPIISDKDGSFIVHMDFGGMPIANLRFSAALVAETHGDYAGVSPAFPSILGNWKEGDASQFSLVIPLKRLLRGVLEIRDQNQEPLVGQAYHVHSSMGLGGRVDPEWGPFGTSGKTDAKGMVRFERTWPGPNCLVVSGDKARRLLYLDLSQTKDGFHLTTAVRTVFQEAWSGTIREIGGAPLADVLVEMDLPSAEGGSYDPQYAKSDASGKYRFSGFPILPSALRVYKPGFLPWLMHDGDNGGLPPGICDIELRRAPGPEGSSTMSLTLNEKYATPLSDEQYYRILGSLDRELSQ